MHIKINIARFILLKKPMFIISHTFQFSIYPRVLNILYRYSILMDNFEKKKKLNLFNNNTHFRFTSLRQSWALNTFFSFKY